MKNNPLSSDNEPDAQFAKDSMENRLEQQRRKAKKKTIYHSVNDQ